MAPPLSMPHPVYFLCKLFRQCSILACALIKHRQGEGRMENKDVGAELLKSCVMFFWNHFFPIDLLLVLLLQKLLRCLLGAITG